MVYTNGKQAILIVIWLNIFLPIFFYHRDLLNEGEVKSENYVRQVL